MTLPNSPTTLLNTIPSYLYFQYSDDDSLAAFISAYNGIAQEYVDWFNTINLPIYTGSQISGSLLDWVGQGLYGLARPTLALYSSQQIVGPYNTTTLNTVEYNARKNAGITTYSPVTDDIYKRIITWHFYKGDGFVFSISWLKRRLLRFLNGPNGTSPIIDQTYDVSITVSSSTFTVVLPTNPAKDILKEAINAGVVQLPFQYTYVVS